MSGYDHFQNTIRKGWGILASIIVIVLLLSGCSEAAQPRTFTIGAVNLTPALDPAWEGFKAGMTELGYIEGENVTYLYDGPAGSIDKLEPIAQSLVEAHVDLIVSLSTPATQAAQKVTADTNMPVVFLPLTDPVGAGIVTSLRNPGGNLTGVTIGAADTRRLQWLPQVVPTVKQIYIPYNPDDRSPTLALATVQEAATALDVEIVTRETRNDDEVTAAIEAIPGDADAIYILSDSLVVAHMNDWIAAALERGLPLSTPSEEHVESGALMSFNVKLSDTGIQAARLAHQILQGTQPADLPVETPDFILSLNLQTAEVIGLDIPDTILRQAGRVIR